MAPPLRYGPQSPPQMKFLVSETIDISFTNFTNYMFVLCQKLHIFTVRCYAKRGICCRRVSVCLSVCVCLTLRYCIKTAKLGPRK